MLDFVVAGLSANSVPYLQALDLQRATHRSVVDGTSPDTVIFLEHPSVYTAGKRTEASERPANGTPVIDVDRGGKITWHGPGQLVGYPILHLPNPIDVVGKLNAPVLGLYGAEDTGIPVAAVDQMKAALIRVGEGNAGAKASQFVVYPGAPHAFHADYRPSYKKDAADDGWKRCVAWFKANGIA